VRQLSLKPQCTEAAARVIVRDFTRMRGRPCISGDRESDLDEAPAGKPPTSVWEMKWLMAHPRFLLRGLKKAKAELTLGVLCYNLKRVINILGVPPCLEHLSPPGLKQSFVCANSAVSISRKIPTFDTAW